MPCLLTWAPSARAEGVTQFHDDARTGWYPDQPALGRSDVQDPSFGQLFSASVRGQVYSQPLVSNGMLLVATEENEVYGLGPATGQQRWHRTLEAPFDAGAAPFSCSDLLPHVGSTSTPVIDPAGTGTAYLTMKSAAGAWRLHALDLQTGAERTGFPVVIGGAADNHPGTTFNGSVQMQRPALLLQNGVVYMAFASHCDYGRYQGWVVGVSTSGQPRGRWVSEPTGEDGAGIWQSGAGLASDGPGRIFGVTSNGLAAGGNITTPAPGDSPPATLSESVVRLGVASDGKLSTKSFFAPFDAHNLDVNDADLGSGGPVLLPDAWGTAAHPHLLATGGKMGYLYLLDRDHLGGFQQGRLGGDASVFRTPFRGAIYAKPSIWPGGGGWLYLPNASENLTLDFYRRGVDGQGNPNLTRWAATAGAGTPEEMAAGTSSPIVTSDGTSPGSALVWIVGMVNRGGGGAKLRVYDAEPGLGTTVAPLRSWAVGTGTRYASPGVSAGRLYVGTSDGHLLGFGRPAPAPRRAAGTDFGAVVEGTASDRTVTLTSQLAGLTVTGPPTVDPIGGFSLGAGYAAPGHALADGESFRVPVHHAASSPPGTKGSTLRIPTSAGEVLVSLSVRVNAATGYLVSSPPVVGFGGVGLGQSAQGQAVFANSGNQDLHLTLARVPAGAFGMSGLPTALANGGTYALAPGASFTATVTFTPRATGSYGDQIILGSDGAEPGVNRDVGVTGVGETPGRLSVPSSVGLGPVVRGGSTRRSVVLRNTGGAVVHLLKYKPPTGGPFALTAPLDEGSTLQGGQAVTATVTFAPMGIGSFTGHWIITADDGAGLHDVALTGAGVASVPAPVPLARVRPAPRLSVLRIVPGWFRVSRHRQPFAGRHGAGRLTLRLSRGARLRCSVLRLGVPARRALRGGFVLAGRRGANLWWLSGRLRGRPLRPGRYRLVVSVPGGRSHSATFGLRR